MYFLLLEADWGDEITPPVVINTIQSNNPNFSERRGRGRGGRGGYSSNRPPRPAESQRFAEPRKC